MTVQAPTARRGAWLERAALLAVFAGLYASGVLSLGHLLDLPVPCGEGTGCAQVAAHPASRLGGVPVACLGVALYLALLAALRLSPAAPAPRLAALALSAAGTAVGLALLVHSRVVIGATCPWCVASHAVLATLTVFTALRLRRPPTSSLPGFGWVLAPALGVAVALGLHAGLMWRSAFAPPVPAERLAGFTRDVLVDPARSLGPADAPVTVLVFADLWCPACRAAHASLRRFQEARSEGVRIAFRHLPLSRIRGHETSAGAAALAEIAAEKGRFWDFVDAVYAQPRPLDRAGYERLWSGLGLPLDELRRLENADDTAVRRVLEDADLADRLGVRATPTFVVFVDGLPTVSAGIRGLPRILNSTEIRSRLAERPD